MGEESWILAVLDGRYVAGYVRRWEDAAGGYRTQPTSASHMWVPQPIKLGDGRRGTLLVYAGFGEPEGRAECVLVGAPPTTKEDGGRGEIRA